MKTILITGASGFLGHFLTMELLKDENVNVIAICGRPEDKANPLPNHTRLRVYPLNALFDKCFIGVDMVINCAFARNNDAQQLAEAIDFTEKEIGCFEKMKVSSVVNISTQGVYKRMPVGELSNEESPIEPVDLYSMAKFATEKMFLVSTIPYVTNVRLASLCMPQRFLYFFVEKAKKGEPFTVTAPNQYAALLDVEDAVLGLKAIAVLAPEKRANVYNLGIGTQYSLLEYADAVKNIGKSLGHDVVFDVADNGTTICAGMDCSRLTNDTGWKPAVLKDEMVLKLYNA